MAKEIKAKMLSKILEVKVQEGDTVKAKDVLLILESMKMKIPVRTPIEGVVKSIDVKAGDTVDRNSLLAVVE
jgi:biotin carboxyl carrier protein